MKIELPPHLSYSQVSTLKKCGEQWRLERGLKVPARPSFALVGGSAVHTATERIDFALMEHGESLDPAEEFHRAFSEQIQEQEERSGYDCADFYAGGRASKQWPNKENLDWWTHEGPMMVANWVNFRDNSVMHVTHIELDFEIELGGVPVKGFIDRIMGDGVVVDLKTGSRAPSDGGMQLGVYGLAVEQVLGIRPTHGYYWMGRAGGTGLPYDLSAWSKDRLDYEFRNARQKQELGIFEANPSPMCSACGVRDFCHAVGGARASEVPRPWEQES